jgi:hypothetical protein
VPSSNSASRVRLLAEAYEAQGDIAEALAVRPRLSGL